jgi:hypothetical protein
MRILLLLIACSAVPSLLALNADIRCGKITDFKKVDAGIVWDWKEDEGYGPEPSADGETFAIVTIKLKAKRSIGKYDYSLNGAKCLAMAKNKDPFRPDYWEQIHEADFDEIHLLYKVPNQDRYEFRYELTNRETAIFLPDGTSGAAPAPAAAPPAAGGTGDIVGDWEVGSVEPEADALTAAAEAAAADSGAEVTIPDNPTGAKWSVSETEINMGGTAVPYTAEGDKLTLTKGDGASTFIPDSFTFTVTGDELKLVSSEIPGYGNKVVTYTLKRAQ